MNKNSTKPLLALFLLAATFAASAQSSLPAISPKLKFSKPQLVLGTNGEINATYLFPDVTEGVDAYVMIESIVNGARLVNIDDSTVGYYDAWQPTVGSTGAYGRSYIKWDVTFKTKDGKKYKIETLNGTTIDTDGDNVRVRELIGINGQDSYALSVQVPSLLELTEVSGLEDINNTDPSNTTLFLLGPVINRANIDTLSQDVRMNFTALNSDRIKFYTGSQIDSNGTTGAIAPDRYHSIYFHSITSTFIVLPMSYQGFTATLNTQKVTLNWKMDNETANDVFEVERSFDQVNFKTCGLVLGGQVMGNNAGQYFFDDKAAEIFQHNVVYYRIKSVAMNSDFKYSSVKMVRMGNDILAKPSFQLYPNPVINMVSVKFESISDGSAEICLINIAGNTVKKITSSVTKGKNTLYMESLASQPSGLYVVNVNVNGKAIASQKILKN